MGYRSEVGVRFSDEAGRLVKKYVSLDEDLQQLVNDADHEDGSKDKISTLSWSWTKWYPDYDEITKFDAMLSMLPSHHFGFMRLGEDNDDVEERGEPWEYDIHLRKEISW